MGDKVTFGPYRVLQRDDGSLWELGRSAAGVTYKAVDTDLERPIALRVINSDLIAGDVKRERFLREARAAAGLQHSHIASIYHLGNDEEQFFYAMELIEGQTIESYVERYGPMPLPAALHVAWQVSNALAVAVKQQLVHRDIKPAKIMIVADSDEGAWPFVKLIDFGLPRLVLPAHDSDGTTQPGDVGIAPSRSSERIEQGNPDGKSDIYSLGCTLWYLLTGEASFTGSLTSDLAQHLGNEAPWACRVWNLLKGEAPATGSVTSALTQQSGGESAWEKLEPFPRRVRDLLRRMLRKGPPGPTSAFELQREIVELQREIERCLADVERREAITARISLPLGIGRQWLHGAPWTRRAAIFGASAMGLVLALAYYWNGDPPQRSAPEMQTSDLVPAETPGDSDQWQATEVSSWSYLIGLDEPFRSLALAPILSFAEPLAADPGIIGAKSWLHAASIWDGGSAVQEEASSGKQAGRSSADLASDQPSAVKGTEDKKVAVARGENKKVAVARGEDRKAAMRKGTTRAKSQVKKTSKRYSYANYAKKPQPRVTSRTKDQGFNPLRVVQQARYHIKRVIRQIF
jgi:serine/threonine protein kinase